jgi:hypothetical protein
MRPHIYADFNNADAQGRLRLNCAGTVADIARMGFQLAEGMKVRVHDEELEADADVHYSVEEQIWVARIDWHAVRQIAS